MRCRGNAANDDVGRIKWTKEGGSAVPCSMLNNVGEAETLISIARQSGRSTHNASGYIFDLAASLLRISSGKSANMA